MSIPISSFDKLTLYHSTMLSSRGQRRGPTRDEGKGKETARSEDDDQFDPDDGQEDQDGGQKDDLDNSEEEESGNQPLDPDPEEVGGDELDDDHIFALYHCGQIEAHESRDDYPCYAFQIADASIERYSVRVTNSGQVKCTKCSSEDGHCRHVNWLLDQLSQAGVLPESDNYPVYYRNISSVGLETICNRLRWEVMTSDADEPVWLLKKDYRTSHFTRTSVQNRANDVRDILATLSNRTFEDYQPEIFQNVEETMVQNVLVLNDLEATVSRLLVTNDPAFSLFSDLVSPQDRALDYFRKMEHKAQDAFNLLDIYIDEGPSENHRNHDIIWCAQALISIVNAISTNYTARQPLTAQARLLAVKVLVETLEHVVTKRNVDAYQGMTWRRRADHAERYTARNLYERLIGSPSVDNPPGSAFVIDALQDMPEAQYYVEKLGDIQSYLEARGWGPAPQTYRNKLISLKARLERQPGPSPSAGPSTPGPSRRPGKRGGPSMDRSGKKRMK